MLTCNHHISPKRKWLPCNNQSNEFRNALIVPALGRLGRDLLQGVEFMKCLLHPASRAAIRYNTAASSVVCFDPVE